MPQSKERKKVAFLSNPVLKRRTARSVRPKRTPTVIGSGYIPYIDKDSHEPETMAGMIGALGGW